MSTQPTNLPIYAVIMAGGSGERFWPLSRIRKPKQLLPLGANGATMLQEALDRIAPIVPADHVLIITSAVLRDPILEALPTLPARNVIAEPCKRNTAPCLALAAAEIIARDGSGNALMAVLTADHFIADVEAFRKNIGQALRHAERTGDLVTLGIMPSRPETGYGYIEVESLTNKDADAIKVAAFREKPDQQTALTYLHDGKHLWNSGMFFWRVDALHKVMLGVLPEVGERIQSMAASLASLHDAAATAAGSSTSDASLTELQTTFAAMPDISIDYGVMERASNVAVVPASFRWDDVGSWDSLLRLREADEAGNVTVGDALTIDAHRNVVVNAGPANHVVSIVGADNLVVVVTPDATLVCSADRAQDVKRAVTTLRSQGRTDVL